MLEKKMEQKLIKGVKQLNGVCLKFHSPYQRGYPDRIVILPKGIVCFVELKSLKGKLAPLQEAAEKKLKSLQQRYFLVRDEQTLTMALSLMKQWIDLGEGMF